MWTLILAITDSDRLAWWLIDRGWHVERKYSDGRSWVKVWR